MADRISDVITDQTADFLVIGEASTNDRRLMTSVRDALDQHTAVGSERPFGGNVYRPKRFEYTNLRSMTQQGDDNPVVALTLQAPNPTLSFLKAFKSVLESNGVPLDEVAVLTA